MHICYLDESGTHAEARYFVVAGLAVFERETYFLSRSLDQIQARYFPTHDGTVAFRASDLRAQEGHIPPPFNTLTDAQRRNLIKDIYQVIIDSNVNLFAVAMEKVVTDGDPYERGFEEIVNRFDLMLAQVLRDRGEPQRGLIVVAESSYRENLEVLAQRIASQGHRWGETHNLADIPYFAPAKSTRLLQLADFVANAVFGRYESGYARYFDSIVPKFHQDQNRLHGLVHRSREFRDCYCPACVMRRMSPHAELPNPSEQPQLPLNP